MTHTPEKRTIVDEAAEAVDEATDRAKTVADNAAARARAEAELQTAAVTGRVSREVDGAASALRGAADRIPPDSAAGRSFNQLADSLSGAADSLRTRDLNQIVEDVRGMARRNPLMFVGGAALLGLAAARFAKARQPLATPAIHTRRRTGIERHVL